MQKTKTINKILVIRFRRIGDAVLSSAICSSLKKSFPNAEIHYVLNENIAPLFENHPDIDKLITFSNDENDNIVKYLHKVWKIVRSNRYDIIVDCRSTVKTLFFSLFSSPTPYKLGISKKYNLISNHTIEVSNYESNVDRMVALLEPVQKELNLQLTKDFVLGITEKEQAEFKSYMIQEGIHFSKPIIVCTIAARIPRKIWNIDYMAEVLLRVIEKYDSQLIFNFVGDEFSVAQSVKEKMGNPSQVFLNVEAKSLRELGALLKNSDFFFGNEGGPRHISQALEIPSLAIYPPGVAKKEWLPNASDKYQGVEPADILSDSELVNLDYTEAFNSMTPDIIGERLFKMLDIYLKAKIN
ncbi:glycosyl transferase family 9 [Paludibacter propionicigenes WB4]|uniref:Glycosyl transferase family 9 n=1 Tax=Paludibacter propionicigenes (strain DSM 17365 / JCM 13257 / WB4) TaxID=694427 RepID=E4T1D1_PALPW|nr:glycosyltransferase family 9 protein [Paludibacter propionicigenes]ADQ78525.1 glycosyl transferase family 9 [Paludibacter propionicigenes WB4]